MKKVIFCLGLLFCSTTYAEEESENQSSPDSNEPTSTSSSQSSIFDRVIETIAEAAVGNRDFGKDISDR